MKPIPFHILTFGCQMNVNDSRWLARNLAARGYVQTELDRARIIILNTCAVREKPEHKVASAIARIAQISKNSPDVLVCVLGCVAQSMGRRLYEFGSQTRLLAGGDNIAQVPDAIDWLVANPAEKLEFLDFNKNYNERGGADVVAGSAYVNIMQGCDNFCAYCIVPFTRGRQKSRTARAVLAECQQAVEAGAKEITLLGQNVNAWGKDSGSEKKFPQLLEEVAQIPGLERLRFVAVHPRDMDRDCITAFARLPNLCPRLHLPLQAGSDRVLTAMRRRYSSADYLKLVDSLRKQRPDLALSTDLIVGFPGETEQDFLQTLAMMKECNFMASYSFCYSDRPNTRASMMPDKIDDQVKLERLGRLQELQEELGRAWLRSRIGQQTKVLLERPSPRNNTDKTFWQGRDPYGAAVNLEPGEGDFSGQIIDVRITSEKKHSLMAEVPGTNSGD